jgi:hypothetical protein
VAAASRMLSCCAMTPPRLSIVVAAIDAQDTIEACLTALLAATADIPSDIVVVEASRDDTRRRVEAFPSVRLLSETPGVLVPHLWARGFHASRGTFVAFTLAQIRVSATWAERLLAAIPPGVAGVGGGFTLAEDTGPAAWALFYLRYSAFIEERWRDGPVEGEIAGDNALYRRSDLEACPPFDVDGFWEVAVHRQLRRRGLTLAGATGATAAVMGQPSPGRVVRERLRHGRRFAASRATSLASRARQVVATPLVPAVLWWRAARRVLPYSTHRLRFLAALPWMLCFATAWAQGEALGALVGDEPAR